MLDLKFTLNHVNTVLERYSPLEFRPRTRTRPLSVSHITSQIPFLDYENENDNEDEDELNLRFELCFEVHSRALLFRRNGSIVR